MPISNRFRHGVLLGDGQLSTGRRTRNRVMGRSTQVLYSIQSGLLGQSHLKPAKTINHGSGWGNHRFKGLKNWFGNVCDPIIPKSMYSIIPYHISSVLCAQIKIIPVPTTRGPRLGCCCLTYFPRPSKASQSHS